MSRTIIRGLPVPNCSSECVHHSSRPSNDASLQASFGVLYGPVGSLNRQFGSGFPTIQYHPAPAPKSE
jgi:hypothetical protein